MPSCHSTNDIGLQIIEKTDTVEGTVIITNEQTQGRGQRGNSWLSEAGSNIMMSLILKPKFLKATDHFVLSMAISLAVRATIEDYSPNQTTNVKWPNDIFLNGFKVAGILIENTVRSGSIENSIIGIGLNVNQLNFQGISATSLRLANDKKDSFSLPETFEKLITHIEGYYLKMKAGKSAEIKEEYLQFLLGYKKLLKFRNEYQFEGIIEGIAHGGQLLVSVDGKLEKFDFKEIEFLL
ncbi:biotin--[acetyl-CoA-carboxylase] ligase [Roseivirga sp.]|uniref:biotin--[acetyl-CoA-carboxylase] ligase n=1 Tax=Roseivirga sp. TaxID=1964215 RepID=UPI003B8BDC66